MNNKPVKIQVPKLTVDAELLGELRELFARAEDQKGIEFGVFKTVFEQISKTVMLN
ncbi:hypothetical protein [uncultured Leuconostoc sp.]|uniref:hypothetical protein n=1 Tax=uncultured Leuconostoc sp. TaxID=173262 RepID=UPI0025EEF5A5|nr:hypothetical protein [uncultured Leuconostoc sp.]